MDLSRRSTRLAALILTAATVTGCGSIDPADDGGREVGGGTMPITHHGPGHDGTVWVANETQGSLTVLDATTGEPITTLTGIGAPHNVQASATQPLVWATTPGGVVAIDATGFYTAHVAAAGEHPAHVVDTPAGDVYVTATGDGAVHHFDPALREAHTIDIGGGPHGMRVAANAPVAAVANTQRGTLDLLNLTSGTRFASVPVGSSPIQSAISADGRTAYASVAGTPAIVRVDVATRTVTGRVRVPSAPAQIWLTDTGLLLSANQGTEADPGHTVSFIDATTMRVTDTVRVGSGPHGITVHPAETRAWVTNAFDDTVSIIDLDTATVTDTVAVGDGPNGITFTEQAPAADPKPVTPLVLPPAYAQPGSGAGHDHGSHEHASHGHTH